MASRRSPGNLKILNGLLSVPGSPIRIDGFRPEADGRERQLSGQFIKSAVKFSADADRLALISPHFRIANRVLGQNFAALRDDCR